MWLMTPTKTRPHKPMLAEWTSEILSLSLVPWAMDMHTDPSSYKPGWLNGRSAISLSLSLSEPSGE